VASIRTLLTRQSTEVVGQRPVSDGALIVGGDYRALATARSLGRRGVPVWVVADDHRIATVSRYTRHSLLWPATTDDGQVEFLLELGSRSGLEGWTIFPTGDTAAALIARHHQALQQSFRLTTAPWDVLRWAYDKRLTYRLAAETGLDYPWTTTPISLEQLATLDCAFPAILKPAVKEVFNSFTHAKAWRVDDRESLLRRYAEARKLIPPDAILVQELVPGSGEDQFSYAALCDRGHPLAWVIARRLRQYPVDFGRASSFVETVDQPEIEEPARRLLARLGYTGLIEVEFKRDPRDGRYKLLDLNPRVWGWHALARRAGVDFPYLQWCVVHGEPVSNVRAKPDVRWIRLATDLPAAAIAMRSGQLTPRAYLQSFRAPLELAMFSIDDPLPALLEIPLAFWAGLRRGAL